jgi:hypothetical protein
MQINLCKQQKNHTTKTKPKVKQIDLKCKGYHRGSIHKIPVTNNLHIERGSTIITRIGK